MFLSRKIGSVLRGKATPFQVMLATVFGGLLGFVPGFFLPGDLGGGFLQAPGLILLLLCCVLVLNANLGVFGLCTLVAKLLSLVVLPVSYAVGRWLLDGPLQGLFKSLVNGKVTAWFGLEYYATVGGLVLGLVFGVASGWLLNRAIKALRTHMAGLEENSERYQKYSGKKSVRFLTWLFLGSGKGKTSWKDLAEQKKLGMPVRIVGVLAAVVLCASVWVFQSYFSKPVLTRVVQDSLQAMNGATVDLKGASIGMSDGAAVLEGLAIADSKDLGKDVFAADLVTAQIDTGELLRKRVVVKNLVSDTARTGSARAKPGRRNPDVKAPPEPPAPPAGTKSIEDWVKDYEVWKQRLQQAQEWIEKISGGDEPVAEPTPEQKQAERTEQENAGLAKVVATHLLDAAPRFVIENVAIKGIGFSLDGKADKLDLVAKNLSDAPSLVDGDLKFDLTAQSGSMAMGFLKPGRANAAADKKSLGVNFAMTGLPVDSVFGQLKLAGAAPLRGGTMNLKLNGGFARGAAGLSLDAPLDVTLQQTTFALAGAKETKVDSLLVPIGLRGPLTRPSVSLDDKVLQDALLKAGQAELANFVQGQAGKLLGGLPTQLQGIVDPQKGVQENVDAAKQKAEAEAKRLADEAKAKIEAEKKKAEDELKKKAAEELKKKLPGGIQIPGFGGGGDKKN
ncbi:MAG: hypothetical protein JNK15_13745 [Planctomycetes bacterium]|nr:hypothetical protein [Planctomycetota bacterium]